ncbi:MAG: sigma 54-interacting transcriptional regulator [Myxococcales bacterium]|nr:sigma 54-interacting transcriptional regulator [Myxococcales bacterium]
MNAAKTDGEAGRGPVAEAVDKLPFDEVHLLCNYSADQSSHYLPWLRARTATPLTWHDVPLSGPTQHREIYEKVVDVCMRVLDDRDDCSATFHLSPGTPAMHAVWILIAKTRIPATLIESSRERGVVAVDIPFDISAELVPELVSAQLADLTSATPPDLADFDDIIHKSREMTRVLEQAARVAPWNVPVLIEGETGTGKELLARAIHSASKRPGKFMPVNCGAIPAELAESTLFGHEGGSFTGASRERRIGTFEAANEGTVFLDELGELPLDVQVKLLRTLQEGEIVRVGRPEPVKIDVRIIAATNRSVTEEVRAGRFREDLFYRLAVAVLRLPPLRDRKGDLTALVDHLMARINDQSAARGFPDKKLSPAARNLLSTHPWPGNIRELENTLRRAVIWSTGTTVSVDDLRGALLEPPGRKGSDILGRPLGDGLDIEDLIAQVQRHYLTRAMEEANGKVTQAYKLVGLGNYQTFSNWWKKLDKPQGKKR